MDRRGSVIWEQRAARAILRRMNPTATPVLPATLTLGAVHLTISDLDRSVAWYQTSLGLRVHSHAGTTRLARRRFRHRDSLLHEDPLARPAGRSSGLYHYALLYPSREEFARAAVRLSVTLDADRRRLRPPHARGDLSLRARRQRLERAVGGELDAVAVGLGEVDRLVRAVSEARRSASRSPTGARRRGRAPRGSGTAARGGRGRRSVPRAVRAGPRGARAR